MYPTHANIRPDSLRDAKRKRRDTTFELIFVVNKIYDYKIHQNFSL
jgi:hypothetical protein